MKKTFSFLSLLTILLAACQTYAAPFEIRIGAGVANIVSSNNGMRKSIGYAFGVGANVGIYEGLRAGLSVNALSFGYHKQVDIWDVNAQKVGNGKNSITYYPIALNAELMYRFTITGLSIDVGATGGIVTNNSEYYRFPNSSGDYAKSMLQQSYKTYNIGAMITVQRSISKRIAVGVSARPTIVAMKRDDYVIIPVQLVTSFKI